MTPHGLLRDPELDARFAREGYAVVDLLDAALVERLRSLFGEVEALYQGSFSATMLVPDPAHRRAVSEGLRELMEPAMGGLAADLRSVFWGFVSKMPAEGASSSGSSAAAMPLHQDISLVAEEERPGLSIWAPLVDVDTANGCLQVVPGSHLLNRGPRAPGTPFPCRELEALIRDRHLRNLELRAGQAVVMDHATFHGSPPNRGSGPRPAVAGILAPPDQPLRYFHRLDPAADFSPLEAFEVDEQFFLSHTLGTRPEGLESLGTVPEACASIRAEQLAAVTLLNSVQHP
ncbi:MAG: phytanoyl-CoA dioxygenase family protein [Acidobacteriota bacterium]